MKKLPEYTNKKGIKFSIDFEKVRVTHEADYWGFYLKATECGTELARVYTVMVKRDLCDTEEQAEKFILGQPLTYLKSAYLDNYKNGSHLLLWPDLTAGWVVM